MSHVQGNSVQDAFETHDWHLGDCFKLARASEMLCPTKPSSCRQPRSHRNLRKTTSPATAHINKRLVCVCVCIYIYIYFTYIYIYTYTHTHTHTHYIPGTAQRGKPGTSPTCTSDYQIVIQFMHLPIQPEDGGALSRSQLACSSIRREGVPFAGSGDSLETGTAGWIYDDLAKGSVFATSATQLKLRLQHSTS